MKLPSPLIEELSSEKFDVIIVGAGPAGSSAACSLAAKGLQVLLLERGKQPGEKNMFGGRIYPYALRRLLGEEWKQCPIERFVTRENITFMTENSSVTIGFSRSKLHEDGGFTALRARFDPWLAQKAEEKGATLLNEVLVTELFRENGRVAGVFAGKDEIRADVVIAADGATSQLAMKAGLRKEHPPEKVSIGMKEVISLPRDLIEDRFGLSKDEGSASVYVGYATDGMRGGGFLYTNRDTVSLGLVVGPKDPVERKVQVHDLVEKFKDHPAVSNLLEDGEVVEYSAHLIPEAGIDTVQRPYVDGLLLAGDAAGFLLNNAYTFRGVDLSIASGLAAAETVAKCKEKGDFSASTLSYYETALKEHGVTGDLKRFRRVPNYLQNPRLYSAYPELLCRIAERVYTVDGRESKKLMDVMREERKGTVGWLSLFRDLIAGARTF